MDFTDWLGYEYDQIIEDDYDYYLAQQKYEQLYNTKFFLGLNPRWQMYRFLPNNLNVMFSATSYWNGQTWRKPIKKFPKKCGLKWLDSGGYLALLKWGHYPFSVVNYANLVIVLQPDFYATMDLACEPSLICNSVIDSVNNRIKMTVKNAVALGEYENQLPGTMVPVIQGYTLPEYLSCIDLHYQNGTIRDYMAIGSMCRRISNKELHSLIPGIYQHAKDAGATKLHFFGLKLSPNLLDLSEFIWSQDSAVAMDGYDKQLKKERNGRRFPRGQIEKRKAFDSFLSRLSAFRYEYLKVT